MPLMNTDKSSPFTYMKSLMNVGFLRLLLVIAFFSMLLAVGFQPPPGRLEIVTLDGTNATPARIELLDREGNGQVADDALPVGGDCRNREEPCAVSMERAMGMLSKPFRNQHNNTTQFYSVGECAFSELPAGSYKLKVYKGNEFQVEEREIKVLPGQTLKIKVSLSRWIDPSRQGWYSADDHLHIARPVEGLNPFISKWMQAEDLHVANLLQWGNSKVFHNTLNYAFGKAGLYREGNYLIATGQENPRTHILGHTIILGANSPINFPSAYMIYRKFFEEAKRQNALTGYAHLGTRLGAPWGLAIDLPSRLLNFLEVLEVGREEWSAWYEILNAGFHLTPTAGTDFPCMGSYPGRDRFYTKVEGSLTYESWLEGIRRGKTFVTNGPLLDFHAGGKEIGDEVVLEKPESITVTGNVRFDSSREMVERLELIEDGQVAGSFPLVGGTSEISFRVPYAARQSSWLALRARGQKLSESGAPSRASLAHTAPIYVTVKNTPPLSQTVLAKRMARAFISRLDDLETRLKENQLEVVPGLISDKLDESDIRRNRAALLQSIESARQSFSALNR